MTSIISSLLLTATCLLLIPLPGGWTQELCGVTCEGSVAQLQCDHGEVISVTKANYGRQDKTTCAAGIVHCRLKNVRCSKAVPQVAEKCNGKRSCAVKVSNLEFGDPCPGTYKYLELDYTCAVSPSCTREFSSVPCEGDVTELKCDPGKVITVHRANYGRHDQTTCAAGRPPSQIQNVKCSRDVFSKVEQRCNGKSSCSIGATNAEFGDPCVGTYKYLKVDYICEVPGTCIPEASSVTCEHATAQLECAQGKVIFVRRANYGRHDQTTCAAGRPSSQIQNVKCSRDVYSKVEQRCNGKSSCSIGATNAEFGDPCVGTYKYLKVDYICETSE